MTGFIIRSTSSTFTPDRPAPGHERRQQTGGDAATQGTGAQTRPLRRLGQGLVLLCGHRHLLPPANAWDRLLRR